jgi:hypothetical protein
MTLSTLSNNKSIKLFPNHSFWFILAKKFPNNRRLRKLILEKQTNLVIYDRETKTFSDFKPRKKKQLKGNYIKFQNSNITFFTNSQISLLDILFQLRTYNLFYILVTMFMENTWGNFLSFLDLLNGVYQSFSFLHINYLTIKFSFIKIYFKNRNKYKNFFYFYQSIFLFYFLFFLRRN